MRDRDGVEHEGSWPLKQVEQNFRTGALRVVDVPAPFAGEAQLLVASRVSLISAGTERQLTELARASLAGKAMARPDLVRRVVDDVRREGLRPAVDKVMARLDTPVALGYSLAGEVLEIGRNVTGVAPGARVACAGAGHANHAEINTVPKNLAIAIPDGVDDEDASFVTLGAIALQGVRLADPTLGERCVVIGLGLVGLLTVQLLKANGCRVLGYDPDAGRASLGRALGADMSLSEDLAGATAAFTDGVGADAVLIAAATKSSEPLNTAARLSRRKGRIVVVGMVGMEIDREPFYRRELDLKLSMSYGPGRYDPAYEVAGHDYPLPYVRWTEQRNMEAFLGLVAEGKVTPKRLVTHRFPIERATEAYALMERGEQHLAILLEYAPPTAHTLARAVRRKDRHAPKRGETGVAFIGCGNYAKSVLLPAVRAVKGVKLTTVVTASGLGAGHACEKYGFAAAATDPAVALSDPGTDAVFIATRHDSHARLASSALRAGKHVFCEKPLALDREGLDEVIASAGESSGLLAVGFNRRFAPLLAEAKAALSPLVGPLVMLYRVNAGKVPPGSWITREEGGGRILGEACHFLDTLTFLSGALPVEVHAIAARGQDDAVSVLVRFADGSTGTIVYSAFGDPAVPKEYLEVMAEGRFVRLEDFRHLSVAAGGKCHTMRKTQDKGQHALVAAFLAAARGERPAPIPLAELAAVTEATFAIEDSLRTGEPRRVDIPA